MTSSTTARLIAVNDDELHVALMPGPMRRKLERSALNRRAWRKGLTVDENRDPMSASYGGLQLVDRHTGRVVIGAGHKLTLAQASKAVDRLVNTWHDASRAVAAA